MSPTFGPTNFSSGHPPPSPPSPPFSANNDPLDDIYGSAPSSPALTSHNEPSSTVSRIQHDEILSDLPFRQRILDTDAYREGLSTSKGQYVQEGFDEGYSLGANLGQQVGYILGVLLGFVTAWRGRDEMRCQESRGLMENAQKELAIQELLGQNWVDEGGIWKWEVEGKEGEVTFREVAEQHPVIQSWTGKVTEVAGRWGVDLNALNRTHEQDTGEARSRSSMED
ncbi:hypothetical protein K469DRAFT_554767 [Zopfia rhizophila CBS 207.26]|uniref:Protein YAE1 n=1 Tax=Zopfia rhizophila CBS 207.26 TaxID=1314779 RepID=A0A6A6ELM0_9PEZI|nr:hypothetical protein K469DRAFT_554767 [Zopfia rhizophila CBS 207.26]